MIKTVEFLNSFFFFFFFFLTPTFFFFFILRDGLECPEKMRECEKHVPFKSALASP